MPELRESAGAVHACRLDHVRRQGDEEVAQQEDAEWQRERRMREPDRAVVARELEIGNQVAEHREQGDESDLHGHQQERDDDQEERVAHREADPRERVRRERADGQRQERRGHGDEDRVDERLQHPLRLEDLPVIVERQVQLNDVPPAGRLDVRARPERRDKQTDRRHEPDHADKTEHDVHRGSVERRDDPARGRVGAGSGEGLGENAAAHVTALVRKRRTLKTMIGTSTTSITTATADP